MSKSKGNFITLIDAVKQYGADSARLATAQAGDSIDDANFTKEIANAAILQLSTL
jgi:leucyl-tRNA synthetase